MVNSKIYSSTVIVYKYLMVQWSESSTDEGIKESERQETQNKGEGQCSVCRIAKAN